MSLRSRLSNLAGLIAPRRAVSMKVFGGLAGGTIILDQLTKLIMWSIFDPVVHLEAGIHKLYSSNAAIELVPNSFHFRFAINTGAAFSFLHDFPGLLTFFSVVIALLMLGWAWFLKPGEQGLRLWLGVILGGALGNLIDRARLGYVIDFLDVHWHESYHWPTFNVADSMICIGIFMLAMASFRQEPQAS